MIMAKILVKLYQIAKLVNWASDYPAFCLAPREAATILLTTATETHKLSIELGYNIIYVNF